MELRRKADSSCLATHRHGVAAESAVNVKSEGSCLLVRVGRSHGEEDEGVHFDKSALNVRFDGF